MSHAHVVGNRNVCTFNVLPVDHKITRPDDRNHMSSHHRGVRNEHNDFGNTNRSHQHCQSFRHHTSWPSTFAFFHIGSRQQFIHPPKIATPHMTTTWCLYILSIQHYHWRSSDALCKARSNLHGIWRMGKMVLARMHPGTPRP